MNDADTAQFVNSSKVSTHTSTSPGSPFPTSIRIQYLLLPETPKSKLPAEVHSSETGVRFSQSGPSKTVARWSKSANTSTYIDAATSSVITCSQIEFDPPQSPSSEQAKSVQETKQEVPAPVDGLMICVDRSVQASASLHVKLVSTADMENDPQPADVEPTLT